VVSPFLILACVSSYFAALLGIASWSGRRSSSDGYFRGNQRAPWFLIAFGLIGDSLSGLTFISVPGQVGEHGFTYLQIILGNVMGYLLIAYWLLPHFYRLDLTSIYGFLGNGLGLGAQRTGAGFFLLSRLLGSAARLYLAIRVFQSQLFDPLGIPLFVSVVIVIALILAYTLKGGIKTLIWTDAFQSGFLLLSVVLSIGTIGYELHLGPVGLIHAIQSSPTFHWLSADWRAPDFFVKQLVSGAAMALVMNGLDQNNMQKNLSCRSLSDAQRNLRSFAGVMLVVNAAFLGLGSLLYYYLSVENISLPNGSTDMVFPELALHHLGPFAAVVFVIGLSAATFNSADSVLTTLTTSCCVDFLNFPTKEGTLSREQIRTRSWVHCTFAALLFLAILGFQLFPKTSAIQLVLELATYTYGPLLGLFALAFFTRWKLRGPGIPLVCLGSPLLSWWVHLESPRWFGGYQMGLEVLLFNGMITAIGLGLFATNRRQMESVTGLSP